MCGQVLASPSSDLLEHLQAPAAEGKLEALESKEMHGCFLENDGGEYECSWTREDFHQVLGIVIGLASDPHPRIRESVAGYMSGSTDARIVEPLGRMLMDSDAKVRNIAVSAFIFIYLDPGNVPTQVRKKIIRRLERLLEDTDSSIRGDAAAALVRNGTRQSQEKLKRAYRRETDQNTRAIMAEIIHQLEGKK